MAEQCSYAATSFAGPKPRRVSVTAAAVGTYTLIVGNLGPADEAISYQVVLTPSASTASTSSLERQPSGGRGSFRGRLPRR